VPGGGKAKVSGLKVSAGISRESRMRRAARRAPVVSARRASGSLHIARTSPSSTRHPPRSAPWRAPRRGRVERYFSQTSFECRDPRSSETSDRL
jgi:hypothetical protein